MHILALGQSNIASHGETPRAAANGRVFHDGAFHPLQDPVTGGTGQSGSVWTRLGDILDRNFVLTLRAQGGTSVADWSAGGRCFEALRQDMPKIKSCPEPVTHILYHQGERDTLLQTGADDYYNSFAYLHSELSAAFPDAVWIICRASWRDGVTSEAVRKAQDRIINKLPNCEAGPDTDALDSAFRTDNTHFNDKGLEAFARELSSSFATIKDTAYGETAYGGG